MTRTYCVTLSMMLWLTDRRGAGVLGTEMTSLVGARGDELPDERHCESKGHRLICFGGFTEKYSNGSNKFRMLFLCDWPNESFEPDAVLKLFPNLRHFHLSHSNVTSFTTNFPSVSEHLEIINITYTALQGLNSTTFTSLKKLHTLDLRHNNFTKVEAELLVNISPQAKVYLSDNLYNCANDMTWLVDERGVESRLVQDKHNMTCRGSLYPGKPLIPIMQFKRNLQSECHDTVGVPYNCSCFVAHVIWNIDPMSLQLEDVDQESALVPIITVNCSHRGLVELPRSLPNYTTTVDATGNEISNLSTLLERGPYRRVSDLFLDDNEVRSISQLEGARWLNHFRVFSLSGNLLTQLPTYALDNALERNANVLKIFLGRNPWRCDCKFTPSFQDLLIKHNNIFGDLKEITCPFVKGDANSNKQIHTLTRGAVCRTDPQSAFRSLDLINGLLGSLIIFVLAKLAYDYYTFKKSGKLPWIVMKMP